MSQSFLLGETILFVPGRNLLIAADDEQPTQVALSNTASQCLLLLLQHHGQVVEREYFFQQVWLNNGSQVTNNNFYQNISLLRRAFKELGLNDDLIITVPKVGIRLSQELQVESHDGVVAGAEAEAPPVEHAALPAFPTPKKRVHRVWPFFMGVLLIGLLGGFFIWHSEFRPAMQHFVPLSDSGECHFYGNPDVMDHDRHQQFIRQNPLDCQHSPWVYLTLYPNVQQRISALRCRQPYSAWRDNQCIMSYYLEDLSHAGT